MLTTSARFMNSPRPTGSEPADPARVPLTVEAGFASETGPRPQNQDFGGIGQGSPSQRISHGIVAAVADGMSSSPGARAAAELVVSQFIEGFYAAPATLGVQRAAGRAIDAVNSWLHATGRRDQALSQAATTFTALILRGRRAHVLHVGDSRAYRLNDQGLTRLTEDHTLNRHDLSHVLYRAVGMEEIVRLDHREEPLRPYDRFLLCSDGVHGALNDRRLHTLLAGRSSPDAVAREVVAAALAAGGTDNATALVVDILALPAAEVIELTSALADLPILPPPAPGAAVDDFELESVLSDGRYSRLYRAVDRTNHRQVVLKFPQPEVADAAIYRAAFLREAWVASRVSSPWIGEVIDLPAGRQSRLYSVMPFYPGETLEQRLNRQPRLGLEEGVGIAVTLAKAVAALHRAGIIHRDIKPDNIILLPDGGLRLIDLGVVRLPHLDEFPEGGNPGTPSYMAPELFAGEIGNEATDLYALGVTVFRSFCRSYPYGEIEPFCRPRFGRPAALAARRPDLPAWLGTVLARAVAVAPEDRFGDVIEFSSELESGLACGWRPSVKRVPVYDRNPVLFWQVVAALLTLALLLSWSRPG